MKKVLITAALVAIIALISFYSGLNSQASDVIVDPWVQQN